MALTTYTAIVWPCDGWWCIRIPGLGSQPDDGLPTQARNFAKVEPMARELIALYLDAPADSFHVELTVELPKSVRQHLEMAEQLAERSAHAQAESASRRRAAARELKALGLTVRDIGAVLGVSHQRAQQLITG